MVVSAIQNKEESRVQKRDKETPGESYDSSADRLVIPRRAYHGIVSKFNFLPNV